MAEAAVRLESPAFQAYRIPGYLDIAVRDFGLSLAAVALARLAVEYA